MNIKKSVWENKNWIINNETNKGRLQCVVSGSSVKSVFLKPV